MNAFFPAEHPEQRMLMKSGEITYIATKSLVYIKVA